MTEGTVLWPPRPLEGQVVCVTGGATGIGEATCQVASAAGAQVAVLDRDLMGARAVAESLQGPAVAVLADVTDRAAIERAFDDIAQRLGPVSGLVCNAGSAHKVDFHELKAGQFERMFEVNVYGCVYPIQAVLAGMRHRRQGAIVNVASVAAHRGGGLFAGSDYAASKGAIVSLTRGLAREYAADGLRINCVAPGPAHTAFTDSLGAEALEQMTQPILLGRMASPEEIARCIVFLLSPLASFVVGEVFNVNGGVHFA